MGGDEARLWEFRELSIPRDASREAARQFLTSVAETDRWELARLRRFPDGRRTVTLRRRVIRVLRTA